MQGIVQDIKERQINGKFGPSTAYTLVVDGNNYGSFEKPECSVGDTVTFEFTENGNYKNLAKGSLSVVSSAPAGSTPVVGVVNDYSELNRRVAIELALKYKPDTEVIDVLANANIFDEYIREGTESEFIQNLMLQGNNTESPLDNE